MQLLATFISQTSYILESLANRTPRTLINFSLANGKYFKEGKGHKNNTTKHGGKNKYNSCSLAYA
jgi:hypothetical protein